MAAMRFPGGKVIVASRKRHIVIGGAVPKRHISFTMGGMQGKGTRKQLLRAIGGSPQRATSAYQRFKRYKKYACRDLPCRRRLGVGRARMHNVVRRTVKSTYTCRFLPVERDPHILTCHGGVRFSFKSRCGSKPLTLKVRGHNDFCSVMAMRSYQVISNSFHTVLVTALTCFERRRVFFCRELHRAKCLHRLLIQGTMGAKRVLISLVAAARS